MMRSIMHILILVVCISSYLSYIQGFQQTYSIGKEGKWGSNQFIRKISPLQKSNVSWKRHSHKSMNEKTYSSFEPSRRQILTQIQRIAITSILVVNEVDATETEEQQILDGSTSSQTNKVLLKGTIVTQPGLDIDEPSESQTPALYITVRPNKPDNVPKAILDGSRGKPPPVLIARYPIPMNNAQDFDWNTQFPFGFTLTEQDLTMEGQSQWFVSTNEDLIVSARLDMDGVAATRDPGDLVGRAIYSPTIQQATSNKDALTVQLQGRGIGGKFVTKKSK